ncbi:MAG: DUF1385 domain-containing protein [Actinobacteria bacterium]|nr:DUF1385 domain-containing protein [Actinomycetota bacterium]
MSNIRVGGQAFSDGVLMRTKKYWALVREDGSTEFGSITSWLDHHPRLNIFFIRSIITFIEMIKFGLRTYSKNLPAANRRLLIWIGIYIAIMLPLSMLFRLWLGEGLLVNAVFQFVSFLTALWTISRGMSGRIWTFHGAEHKAVNAYEQGKDIEDVAAIQSCSRIHQRCGTNLVFLVLVIMALYFPYPGVGLSAVFPLLYTVFALAISLELFRQLIRFPKFIVSRMILFGGQQLQRFMTTKEPDDDQVIIASKALQLVLALESTGDR